MKAPDQHAQGDGRAGELKRLAEHVLNRLGPHVFAAGDAEGQPPVEHEADGDPGQPAGRVGDEIVHAQLQARLVAEVGDRCAQPADEEEADCAPQHGRLRHRAPGGCSGLGSAELAG